MTSFKNFLKTRNENRLKTFFRDSNPTTSLDNAEIQENVIIGQGYKGSLNPLSSVKMHLYALIL